MSKERKGEKVMVGIYFNPNVLKILKIKAAVEGRSVSEIVEESVVNHLFNPTRQPTTLDDVNRMIDKVRGKLTQITGTP